jgi:hypothetical protein
MGSELGRCHDKVSLHHAFNSMGFFVGSWSFVIFHWSVCMEESINLFVLVVHPGSQCLNLNEEEPISVH